MLQAGFEWEQKYPDLRQPVSSTDNKYSIKTLPYQLHQQRPELCQHDGLIVL